MIDPATNTVTGSPIPVGLDPTGVAVNPVTGVVTPTPSPAPSPSVPVRMGWRSTQAATSTSPTSSATRCR
nr:hypothetical protein [Mycobacterium tuberculosis]